MCVNVRGRVHPSDVYAHPSSAICKTLGGGERDPQADTSQAQASQACHRLGRGASGCAAVTDVIWVYLPERGVEPVYAVT